MTKGFFFTFDALFCLLLFVGILFLIPQPLVSDPLFELAALQKLHDLQKIWSRTAVFDLEEMKHDLLIVFPENDFDITRNATQIEVRNHPTNQNQKIESEMAFVQKDGAVIHLRIGLYYQ